MWAGREGRGRSGRSGGEGEEGGYVEGWGDRARRRREEWDFRVGPRRLFNELLGNRVYTTSLSGRGSAQLYTMSYLQFLMDGSVRVVPRDRSDLARLVSRRQ